MDKRPVGENKGRVGARLGIQVRPTSSLYADGNGERERGLLLGNEMG